jgi:hypothetical protein
VPGGSFAKFKHKRTGILALVIPVCVSVIISLKNVVLMVRYDRFDRGELRPDPSWCFKNAVNSSLPGSFFSFEGLTVDQDLDSAINLTSQTTVSILSDGEAGNHPLPTSIQPISWAVISSLTPTSVPLLTTSEDVNTLSAELFTDVPPPSLPSEPTPQAASVDSSSS